MPKPELKNFFDLTPDDFTRHPAWVQCITRDQDEDWFDIYETDEETLRPHDGPVPIAPRGVMFVRATAVLADGTRLPACVTPVALTDPAENSMPWVYVDGKPVDIWGKGVAPKWRDSVLAAMGRTLEAIYPVLVTMDEGLATGRQEFHVPRMTTREEEEADQQSRRWWQSRRRG